MVFFFDLIGYMAVAFHVAAFLTKNRTRMLSLGISSTLLFGASLFIYDGLNGLFVAFLSVFAKSFALQGKAFYSKVLMWFSPLFAVVFYFVFNYESLAGLLPAASLMFILIADGQKDLLAMKQWYIGSALCWLTYGVVLGSLPAILYDVFGLSSLLYVIYALKKEKREFAFLKNS